MPPSNKFTTASQALATYDYFDSILGVGFKNFYPATGFDSTSVTYFLTTDATIASDNESFIVFKTDGGTTDLDFDILIEKPFTIAAKDALFSWTSNVVNSVQIVWNIIHVDSGNSETNIGTVTSEQETTTGQHKKLARATMTRKHFTKGDKLRINPVITTGLTGDQVFFDPAGIMTFTETSFDSTRGINSNCTVKLPIENPE